MVIGKQQDFASGPPTLQANAQGCLLHTHFHADHHAHACKQSIARKLGRKAGLLMQLSQRAYNACACQRHCCALLTHPKLPPRPPQRRARLPQAPQRIAELPHLERIRASSLGQQLAWAGHSGARAAPPWLGHATALAYPPYFPSAIQQFVGFGDASPQATLHVREGGKRSI